MRFLVDMGIALDVAEALRGEHDAVHLREQGLGRLSDSEVLAKAGTERRIVVTHDLDMGRLLAVSRARFPSVITFRLSNMTPDSVLPRLMEAIRVFAAELEEGAAVTVDDRSIRCHALPIEGPRRDQRP